MINPRSAIELDELRTKLCRGGEKSRRAGALLATLAIALCPIVSIPTAAQQKSETALTPTQLEELLDKATTLKHKYHALSGFTIFNAAATHKNLRPLFKYEFAGRERVRDQDLVVVEFEQIEFKKDLFGTRLEMFLNGRITSEYSPFRRFEVKSRHENVPNQYRER